MIAAAALATGALGLVTYELAVTRTPAVAPAAVVIAAPAPVIDAGRPVGRADAAPATVIAPDAAPAPVHVVLEIKHADHLPVFIDRDARGMAPTVAAELVPGYHLVSITPTDGRPAFARTITVDAAGIISIDVPVAASPRVKPLPVSSTKPAPPVVDDDDHPKPPGSH